MPADALICTGCGRELDDFSAGETETVRCVCRYITLIEQGETPLPLAESLRVCLPDEAIRMIVRDSDEPAYVRTVVETCLQRCLQRARAIVAAEPDTAAASVWACLVRFDSMSREYRAGARALGQQLPGVGRTIQILLTCLYQEGMARLPAAATDAEAVRGFIAGFSEATSNVTTLGNILADLEWDLMEGRLQDGTLYVRKMAVHTRLREWTLNRDALWQRTRHEPTSDDVFSAASTTAQEIFLGCSPALGRELFANKHDLLRTLARRQERTVYEIPEAVCSEPLRSLFDHLVYTQGRIARFALPFYWDLGIEENDSADPQRDLRKVAVRNWFNYYPLVPVEMASGGPGYFVSAEILTYALGNLESYKGRLLQRIAERLREAGPSSQSKYDAVNALRKKANTRFEALATERARALGFAAMTGLDRLDGTPLPGGEIDLLMASAQGDDLLLVLAEVKDLDMTLMRVHGEKALRGKIRGAEGQLDRKADDVRANWQRLLDVISAGSLKPPTGRVILVRVLITSSYLPPFLSSSCPAIALEQMAEFAAMLRQGVDAFPPRFATTAREVLA